MTKKSSLLSLFLCLLMAISCSDRMPKVAEKSTFNDQERVSLNACRGFSPVSNLLEKENILSLFRCQKWNEKYPLIFKAIGDVPAQSWNFLFHPWQTYFYDNHQKRDEVFGLVLELDNLQALDDVAEIISTFLQTNFHDSLHRIIAQALDKNDLQWSLEELKNFLKLLNLSKISLKNLPYLLGESNKAFAKYLTEFKKSFAPLARDEHFKKLRVQALDGVAIDILDKDFDDEERKIFVQLFTTTASLAETYQPRAWVSDWLNSYQESELIKLIEIPSKRHPQMLRNLRFLLDSFPTLQCRNSSQDLKFQINIREEMETLIKSIRGQNMVSFHRPLLDTSGALFLSEGFCQLQLGNQDFTLTPALFGISELLESPAHFEFAHFAQMIVETQSPQDPFKLLSFASGKTFSHSQELLSRILEIPESSKLIPILLKMLKQLPGQVPLSLGNIINEVFGPQYLAVMKSIAKFWIGLEEKEKFNFLAIFDTHFMPDAQSDPILRLYLKLTEEIETLLPHLARAFNADADKTIQSLYTLTSHFLGEEMRKELQRFYGRDQIIETVRALGYLFPADRSDYLSQYKSVPFPGPVINHSWHLDLMTPYHLGAVQQISDCLKDMFSHRDLFDYIKNAQGNCSQIESHEVYTIYLIDGIRQWAQNNPEKEDLFRPSSLLGPEMVAETMNNLIIMNETPLEFDQENHSTLETIINHFSDQLTLPGGEKALLHVLSGLDYFLSDEHQRPEAFLKAISLDEDNQTLLLELAQLMKDYGLENEIKFDLGRPLPCQQFFPNQFGVQPCPDTKEITFTLLKSFYLLTKQYQASLPLLKYLVDWASPLRGISIPFQFPEESKPQHQVQLKLNELISFIWDFTRSKKSLIFRTPSHQPEGDLVARAKPARLVEHLEVVIRSARFEDGEIGAYFVNELAKSANIPYTLAEKKKMLVVCAKPITPFVCGGWVNGSHDKRLSQNALSAFAGLEALGHQFQHSLGPSRNYLDTAQGIFTAVISSSAPKAQRSSVIRLTDGLRLPRNPKDLHQHNYQFLLTLANGSVFSNFGRFLLSRFGEDEQNFYKGMNEQQFLRLNDFFLRGVTPDKLTALTWKFIDQQLSGSFKILIPDIVNWVSKLSFEETRFVERTIFNLFTLLTYIGEDPAGYPSSDLSLKNPKFKNLHSGNLIHHLDKFIEWWQVLAPYFKKSDFNLMEMIRPLHQITEYFLYQLAKDAPEEQKQLHWRWLNRGFMLLEKAIFPAHDLLIAKVKKGPQILDHFVTGLTQLIKFKDRKSLYTWGRYLETLTQHPQLKMNHLQNLIDNNLNPYHPHYGQFFRVFHQSLEDQTLMKAIRLIFIEDRKNFADLILRIFSRLSLGE